MTLYFRNEKLKLLRNGKEYNFENPFSSRYNYVSLGDSIAGGHSINDRWAIDYGENSQYGKNGNKSTVIVPNSYTDLIRSELHNKYGANQVSVTSFARSGDAVVHLMDKLSKPEVINAIKNADLVTICIGANDILSHVWPELQPYIDTGDLSNLEKNVENSLSILNTDSQANSYVSLFNKLNAINPNAKYVFTTVYNPYKYLWLDESRNGFFKPVLDVIPHWDITIPIINKTYNIDGIIKDTILKTPIIQKLFNRVNGLCYWVEKYIEGDGNFNGLNRILKNKINNYQSVNENFSVVDSKALFDTYPDRPTPADVHYNDLVNVEFTRGYNTAIMDWGALWRGSDASTYWFNLMAKHTNWKMAFPSMNVADYVDFNIEALATELVTDTINKVIVPNIDPHPETYGHYVLKQSFLSALK